jgi:DNA-binding CsgD family transcriptional regulator
VASAAGALRQTHTAASRAGLADNAARALVTLAGTMLDRWEFDAAGPIVEEALGYCARHGLDGYLQYVHGMRANMRVEQCAWDAALADAEESLARPSRSSVAVVPALVARGRVLAARGDATALSTLDQAAEHAFGTGEIQRIGPVASARSEYFLIEGDPDRAAEEARTGLALAIDKGNSWFTGELTYRLWQAAGPGAVTPTGTTPFRLMMEGDWAAAAQRWAELGRGYARVAALSQGDRPAAAQALRILTELGAVRAARDLRARLRDRGMTGVPRGPRPSTAANAAGLTARQVEVLALLAEGLSNADIAARLTVSHRTVEHHVSAVLVKLAVATRGQAIVAAHRLNLVG